MSDTEQFETRAMLSAFFVTTPVDANDTLVGDGIAETDSSETSLRAAIQEANHLPGPDSIQLPGGLFVLDAAFANGTPGGVLEVSDNLAIQGAGPDETILDATQIDQLFEITGGATLELRDLTIQVADLNSIVNAVDGLAPLKNVALVEIPDESVVDAEDPETETLPDEETAIPARLFEALSSNPRQLQLLEYLSRPVQAQNDLWHSLTAVQSWRQQDPDAAMGVSIESDSTRIPELPPRIVNKDPNMEPQEIRQQPKSKIGLPGVSNPKTANADAKTNPNDTTAKRRADVVNSLFEENRNEKGRISPVGGESKPSKTDARSLNSEPGLLPHIDRLSPELRPNPAIPMNDAKRPAAPPLPELRPDHDANANSSHSKSSAVAAGVLLAFVRPKTWQRALKKLAKRK
jgi:hypothetical protein